MNDHLKNDLGMQKAASDMGLFFRKTRGMLSGLIGTYVDDSMLAGDPDFLRHTDQTLQKFDSKGREMDNTSFAGVYIETLEKGFKLHQKSYAKRIEKLPMDCSFKDFRSRRAKIAWLIHTKPNIACDLSMLAKVTQESFNTNNVKKLNKFIDEIKENPTRGLVMKKLDKNSLHIRAYADSSFLNNNDMSSQLGFIVLLCDKYDNCNILHCASYKSRRVVR